MKFRLRPHSKDQSKALNPEPTPEKKPLIINYDRDGVRIGDDGYSMTPKRSRLHTMLNVVFVWGIICALGAVACAVIAFAQGQQYGGFHGDFASFDLEVYGGNMINGYSVATLLRVEGILCLLTAIFGPVISIQAFHWFYDRRPVKVTAIMMSLLALACIGYEISLLVTVGLPDPVCLITLIMLILIAVFMRQVFLERPTLSKAKVAKTVTKK
ncbi:MAG: hypothetical protein ACLU06_00960 [Eggerthellaceae bacterium]